MIFKFVIMSTVQLYTIFVWCKPTWLTRGPIKISRLNIIYPIENKRSDVTVHPNPNLIDSSSVIIIKICVVNNIAYCCFFLSEIRVDCECFAINVTRRVPPVEQKPLTHPVFIVCSFVFLSFFFWPLYGLSLFDLRLLIISMVPSNFSHTIFCQQFFSFRKDHGNHVCFYLMDKRTSVLLIVFQ